MVSKLVRRTLLAVGAAAILSSCASSGEDDRCSLTLNEIYSRIDTRALMGSLVTDLCPVSKVSLLEELREHPVIVPDVLNVQSLQPENLGLALGELLRSSISNVCQTKIRQVDLSRDLQLNQRGIVALTREAAKARNKELDSQYAFIVTYNAQPTKLTLVARNVDLASATIVSVSTKEVTWSCKPASDGSKKFGFRID